MAKFYIVNDSNSNKLWLVDMETRSAECLDRDVIESLGLAGHEFLNSISGLTGNDMVARDGRSDPSERIFAFDGRTDPSERAFSFDARSDPSDRAFSFDGRSGPSDRAFSFDGRSDPSDRAFSFDSRSNPSERMSSASPAGLN
ncbi:hypothetical protein CU102_02595 [Phyllobacterium brassicacearum]|uniref:Uncharacterized protein n=1 Tax=Phyllobacterium brassicacearum TaxID=314235 RepID=A0A2P7BWW0_9HYPH|nr:hypothetical protein [Phyllobacterium brassicacearum]PSH70953.1 hypothetical protein CU102_02595 [Phyllobacterium brassicacearum]TDQ35544.1 hypothetical protein DEV91_10126 [Phyllobacterium brassicacearum]